MSDWLFWLVLCSMLLTGHTIGAGLFMLQFTWAALSTAALAGLFPVAMEQQLHFFLFASAVQLLYLRSAKRRKAEAAT